MNSPNDCIICDCGNDIKVLPTLWGLTIMTYRLVKCNNCELEWLVKPSGRRFLKYDSTRKYDYPIIDKR